MKDITPEELAEMEESIPEWKRNALVLQSDDEEELKVKAPGYLRRMKNAAGEKINSTEAAQKFYDSEEYKKVEKMRIEAREFKSELRESIDASHSPVVQMANQAADKVINESACAMAIKSMKRYDPDFDLEDLTDEAMEIF